MSGSDPSAPAPTDAQIGARIFTNTTFADASPKAPVAPPAGSDADVASRLYDHPTSKAIAAEQEAARQQEQAPQQDQQAAPVAAPVDPAVAAEQAAAVAELGFLDASHPEAGQVAVVAKQLGLGAEQVARLAELRVQLMDRQSNDWKAQALATVPKQTIAAANETVRGYPDKAFHRVLSESGLANHPAVIKFLASVRRR